MTNQYPSAAPPRAGFPWAFALGLLGLCALAWGYRLVLDQSADHLQEIYLERFYRGYMDRLLATKPWWYFLLPMPDIKGVWATTGFVLIYFLERALGPNSAFLLLQAAATAGVGVGTRLATARTTPALVAAGLFAFSPFNYSVYLWNGSNNAYTTVLFLSLAFGCFVHYVVRAPRVGLLLAGTVSLVAGALSYEVWLDAVAVLTIITGPLVVFLRRRGDAARARRCLLVFAITFGLGVLYTVVRLRYLHMTAIPGLEFQLLWTHATIAAMVDDLVFNVVFLAYLALLQFMPGWLGTSAAIHDPGRLDVDVLQSGYVPELYPYVAQHYLNLWMLYAGAAYVAVAAATLWLLRRGFARRHAGFFVGGLFGLAVLIGSPTHALLKFVAFNGVPFYSYKSTVTVWLLCIGGGLLFAALRERLRGVSRLVAVAVLAGYVLLVAFTRPQWANENIREIWGEAGFFGNGFYPDPWRSLRGYLDD